MEQKADTRPDDEVLHAERDPERLPVEDSPGLTGSETRLVE
jgi:hypothetical protein